MGQMLCSWAVADEMREVAVMARKENKVFFIIAVLRLFIRGDKGDYSALFLFPRCMEFKGLGYWSGGEDR